MPSRVGYEYGLPWSESRLREGFQPFLRQQKNNSPAKIANPARPEITPATIPARGLEGSLVAAPAIPVTVDPGARVGLFRPPSLEKRDLGDPFEGGNVPTGKSGASTLMGRAPGSAPKIGPLDAASTPPAPLDCSSGEATLGSDTPDPDPDPELWSGWAPGTRRGLFEAGPFAVFGAGAGTPGAGCGLVEGALPPEAGAGACAGCGAA